MKNSLQQYITPLLEKYKIQKKWSFIFFLFFTALFFVWILILFVAFNTANPEYTKLKNIQQQLSTIYSGDKFNNEQFSQLWSDSFFDYIIKDEEYMKDDFLIWNLYTLAWYSHGLKDDITSLKVGFTYAQKWYDHLENAMLLTDDKWEYENIKKNYQTALDVYSTIWLKLCFSGFPEAINVIDKTINFLSKYERLLILEYSTLIKKQKQVKDIASKKCLIKTINTVVDKIEEIKEYKNNFSKMKKDLQENQTKLLLDPALCFQKQNLALDIGLSWNIPDWLQEEYNKIQLHISVFRTIDPDEFAPMCGDEKKKEDKISKDKLEDLYGQFDFFGEIVYIITSVKWESESVEILEKTREKKITTLRHNKKQQIKAGKAIHTLWTKKLWFLQPDINSVKFFDKNDKEIIIDNKKDIILWDKETGWFVFGKQTPNNVYYMTCDLRTSNYDNKITKSLNQKTSLVLNYWGEKAFSWEVIWSDKILPSIKEAQHLLQIWDKQNKKEAMLLLEKAMQNNYSYALTNFKEFADLAWNGQITRRYNLKDRKYLEAQEKKWILYCETANKILSLILDDLWIENVYTEWFYSNNWNIEEPMHTFLQVIIDNKRHIIDATPEKMHNKKAEDFSKDLRSDVKPKKTEEMKKKEAKKKQDQKKKKWEDGKDWKEWESKEVLQNLLNQLNKMNKDKYEKNKKEENWTGDKKEWEDKAEEWINSNKDLHDKITPSQQKYLDKIKKEWDQRYQKTQEKEKNSNYSSKSEVERIFRDFNWYFQDYIEKAENKQKVPEK